MVVAGAFDWMTQALSPALQHSWAKPLMTFTIAAGLSSPEQWHEIKYSHEEVRCIKTISLFRRSRSYVILRELRSGPKSVNVRLARRIERANVRFPFADISRLP